MDKQGVGGQEENGGAHRAFAGSDRAHRRAARRQREAQRKPLQVNTALCCHYGISSIGSFLAAWKLNRAIHYSTFFMGGRRGRGTYEQS